ncbi:MAG: putative DNA-binding domain-containing protein [Candidatus Phaeomarinobacter sp.]
MSRLAELQRTFAASLRDPADGQVLLDLGCVGSEPLPHRARLDVYRNNVASSLTDALAALYPVCQRLVGEEFFRAAARAYLDRRAPDALPRQASLIGYAPDFAGFLVSFEPVRSLPYLPDVARLEHAWHRVYHGADATPVTAQDLQAYVAAHGEQALDQLVLGLVPAHQLLMSPYPVSRIWQANQTGHDGHLTIAEGDRNERIFVVRPQAQVEVRRVSPAAFAFLCAVQGGATLGRALIAAFEEEADDTDTTSDPQMIFAELLNAGSFILPPAAQGAAEGTNS